MSYDDLDDLLQAAGYPTTRVPVQHDTNLPPCPLCQAPARALTFAAQREYDSTGLWHHSALSHDCNCEVSDWPTYHTGIMQLYTQARYRQAFTGSLKARYRNMITVPLEVHRGNRAAVKACVSLEPGSFVYLYGERGIGKTHLGLQTTYRLISEQPGAFWSSAEWLEALRKSFVEHGPKAPDLKTPGVLMLDDIGKEKPSEWVAERVFELLEHRWSDAKTTILTSQYSPDVTAERLYPSDPSAAAAIMSRLASGVVEEVTGTDRRMEHHQ